MQYLLTRWLIVALSLALASAVIPGVVIEGVYAALISAVLLGLVNVLVRPVLFILTIPITVVTLGLFIIVINGLLFWFVASFVDGFAVSGFWSAIGGALVVSLVSYLGNRFVINKHTEEASPSVVIDR